ncbi:HNH endonuclease [Candidatus Eisenbacteria bacterium]|uniref:HNH endonuclease n=1 Tax=Eiseniibacteriota bacterium TaxID=2212470 RepID=A0ABV6YKW1_UNCEI
MPKTTPTGYWTFFCNPAKWEIDRFLATGRTRDHYSITDWQAEWFAPGQLGVIRVGIDRRSKKVLAGRARLRPGVYAIVHVLEHPRERGRTDEEFWVSRETPDPTGLVVEVEYVRTLLDSPIHLAALEGEGIEDRYLLEGFQAASMPLTASSFRRVRELARVDDSLLGAAVRQVPGTVDEIARLESRYGAAAPEVSEIVSKRIERGPAASRYKKVAGYRCQLCEQMGKPSVGFTTIRGVPYIEVHHVRPVSTGATGTLGPSNLIAVCANHHRQLHYGRSELVSTEVDHFEFVVDGKHVRIPRLAKPVAEESAERLS